MRFQEFWENRLREADELGEKLTGATVVLHSKDHVTTHHCGEASDENTFMALLRCIIFDCVLDYEDGRIGRTDDDGE